MNNERRIVRLMMATDLLSEMVTQGYTVHAEVIKGLPEGAVACSAALEWFPNRGNGVITATFYHPSFAVVPEGQDPPIVNITVRNYWHDHHE